ncbi:acyltransferase family protein [Mycobacterium sp. Marseille-P9652]|uniref:acyltransferase family protein n=1 Tax=Mycobacterium sp. Marseille-P9652 TaxID=2654950 RepID=UPI00351A5BB7
MHPADSVSTAGEAPTQRSTQPQFRPDIEGLRAVAVVAVVLFHAELPGVSGGFTGVDVFFVISGFLITGMLLREVNTTGNVRLRRFYGARARRLLPASATVGVATVLGAAVLLPVLQAEPIIRDGIASALYIGNYWFALQGVDYLAATATPSPFQHYWSLGVEEQFYLVWPAMIIGTAWLVRRVRRRTDAASSQRPYLVVLALVAAISFAMSLALTHLAPPVAFFSLPTRAWELAAGGLVALTGAHWRRLPPLPAAIAGWSGLGLILLACTCLGPTTPYPGTAALLPVLGAVLVIGAGCAAPAQGSGRVLGVRPMRAIGRVSYSWYLWHWPMLMIALWSLAPVMGHAVWLALAAVLISLALAVLTLRIIENPLRFAPSMRRSAARSLALGGGATSLVVCVGVALLMLLPTPVGRGPNAPTLTVTVAPTPWGSGVEAYDATVRDAFAQVQAAVAASVAVRAVPSNLKPPLAATPKLSFLAPERCLLSFFEIRQPECATGDATSTSTIALVGDSNAEMWRPALQHVAEQRRWRLETMTKVACPLLNLPIRNPVFGREYSECEQWGGQITARLRNEHPRLVVLSAMRRYGALYGITPYGAAWMDSLRREVLELRGIGAQVLVLGPIPDPHVQAPFCLSSHLDDATACSSPRSTAVDEAGIAAESAAIKAAGGQYADLSDLFCTAERCPVIVGNALVYQDENHVTAEYARLLAPLIGALADRALARG